MTVHFVVLGGLGLDLMYNFPWIDDDSNFDVRRSMVRMRF